MDAIIIKNIFDITVMHFRVLKDLYTYLTSWSPVLFQKLIVPQWVKKLPLLYGTIGTFPCSLRDHHLSLSSTRLTWSIHFHPISVKIHFNILQSMPMSSQLSLSCRSTTETLYTFCSPLYVPHTLPIIILDLIT